MGVEFQTSIDDARKADKNSKPMVVQFGASWCGWCRKMTFGTFDAPKVEAIAKDYLWVAIDIDEQPEIAARFGVASVPHTVLLDKQGRVLGSEGGYFPPDKFVEFLDQSRKNPQPEEIVIDLVERFLKDANANDPQIGKDTIERMVEQLSRPTRYGRDEILDAFEKKGRASWPVLVELLSDERLSTRAAAAGALKRSTGAELPFHPFEKSHVRERQVLAWKDWIASQHAEKSAKP
jgi:thiol-disulfide isomerase/thioredoxin